MTAGTWTPVQTPNIDFYFYTDETTRDQCACGRERLILLTTFRRRRLSHLRARRRQRRCIRSSLSCAFRLTVPRGSPLADPKVRQAISYAIKRDDVINAKIYGTGRTDFGFPTIVGQNGYDGKYDNYFSYDPEKAKELLAEAGYPDGFSCKSLSLLHLCHA